MFKKLNSKSVYKNKWTEVFEDEIEFPNSQKGIYGYMQRSDGAGVAVINDCHEILLIKQYRYPIGKMQWGIPGGAIDGTDPEQSAIRELKEETGVTVISIEKLVEVYPLSSGSTEKEYIYFARVTSQDLPSEDVSDADEFVGEKRFVPILEALQMIDAGENIDPVTSSVIQMLARKLKLT
ncbi:NUDIX hydrolase [Candidatus Woesebacteria bacterium]|nr:NUDIX hydrolase [Candidatus Woesebacteria bacterium]